MVDADISDGANYTWQDLPPLPPHMVGRPFGMDEEGKLILEIKGPSICSTINYMLACVERRTKDGLAPETMADQRDTLVAVARAAALNELVNRLNAAIADESYFINGEYLLDEGHNYSFEFDVFLTANCRELSGDPQFVFNAGTHLIPPAIALLARPLSLRQTYNAIPRFAARFTSTDLRVVSTNKTSSIVQWRCQTGQGLPTTLRPWHILIFCDALKGILASLPNVIHGLPLAEVKEMSCQAHGDE